jgi:DNA-binding PadR family transcriptional regulator
MVQKRWIKGEWGISENNRRAKFYRLTKAGEREFEQQATGWLRLSDAVSRAVTRGAQ